MTPQSTSIPAMSGQTPPPQDLASGTVDTSSSSSSPSNTTGASLSSRIQSSNDAPTTTTNGVSSHSHSQPPASARELPPEAIALASRLFDMARQGETRGLESYLQAGIPPNLTNSTGDTLLMLAAYHNREETVASLLERGADPDALNGKGQSPLAGAIFKGHTEVVRTLVHKGHADVRKGKPNAVECAAMFKRWEEAEIMGVLEEAKQLAPNLNPVGSRDG